MFIVIILIIKESIKLRNTILYNKHIEQNLEVVLHTNFTKLPFKVVDVDHRIPKGQWAHFAYDIPNLSQSESKRKYVGNTLLGIKLLFVNLFVQNKELKDTIDLASRGPTRITLTNKLFRAQTQDSNISLKKEIKWSNIEQVRFVLDNKFQ